MRCSASWGNSLQIGPPRAFCWFALTPVQRGHSCSRHRGHRPAGKVCGEAARGAWPPVPARQLPQDKPPLGGPSVLSMTQETAVPVTPGQPQNRQGQIWRDPGYTADSPSGLHPPPAKSPAHPSDQLLLRPYLPRPWEERSRVGTPSAAHTQSQEVPFQAPQLGHPRQPLLLLGKSQPATTALGISPPSGITDLTAIPCS